jgi:quinol monooxygenase YgiN
VGAHILAPGEKMIVVNVAIESSESDITALKPAIAAMEQASRAEEGCDDYTFSIELNNPDIIRITERWQSMEALETHFGAPHMAEFQAAMAQHAPKGSQAYFYEASEVSPPGG